LEVWIKLEGVILVRKRIARALVILMVVSGVGGSTVRKASAFLSLGAAAREGVLARCLTSFLWKQLI
jgi:hypothetical protein